jgi:hypothetical protein
MTTMPSVLTPCATGISAAGQSTAAPPPARALPSPSTDDPRASAHLVSMRDKRGRAVLQLVEPRTPDINKYLKAGGPQDRLEPDERKEVDETIQKATLGLCVEPGQASITPLLKQYDELACNALPEELKMQRFKKESMTLRSHLIGNALITLAGSKKQLVGSVLRSIAVRYVAARHQYSIEAFHQFSTTIQTGQAAASLMRILSNLGVEGLLTLQDFESYLQEVKGISNSSTIRAYRTVFLQMISSGVEVFATSTVYPKAQRLYGWSVNEADTEKVIQHCLAVSKLKRSEKIQPAAGEIPQQTTDAWSQKVARHKDRSQFVSLSNHIRGFTNYRLSLPAAESSISSSSIPCAANSIEDMGASDTHCAKPLAREGRIGSSCDPLPAPEFPLPKPTAVPEFELISTQDYPHSPNFSELCAMLTEGNPSAYAPACIFMDLDLSYFDKPVAGSKRNAKQAFGSEHF